MPRLITSVKELGGQLALVPVYQNGRDLLAALRGEGPMHGTILKYTRNVAMEDWYWRLVHYVADGVGISKDMLHADLKLKAELIKFWLLTQDGTIPILRSTRREDMSGVEFRAYVDHAVTLIFEHYIDAVRDRSIRDEVNHMVGDRPA